MELQEETGTPVVTKKSQTPLQAALKKLNNFKKKQDLVTFCIQEYQLPIGTNDTVAQIQKRALAAAYEKVEPWGQDPAGFGKFAELSYQQIRDEQEGYAKWVLQTYKESPEADFRLKRLGAWLASHPKEANDKKTTIQPKSKGRGKVTGTSSTSSQDAVIQQMAETIQMLRQEIEELKDDRNLRHRRPQKSTGEHE
jgi:hypothetical protein